MQPGRGTGYKAAMLRRFCIALMALTLCMPAHAQDKPLPPGRPAGVRAARFHMNSPLIATGSAIALVVGGLYLSRQSQTAATSTTP